MKAPAHRHHTRWCSHRTEFWRGKWIRCGDHGWEVVAVQEATSGGFQVLLRSAEQIRLQGKLPLGKKGYSQVLQEYLGYNELWVDDTSKLVQMTDEEINAEKMLRKL